MTNSWRLIQTKPLTGSMNMALDEALLNSVCEKSAPPSLRLYSWHPPTLSLGYAQSINDVNIESLNRFDWNLVRRPTGGRAILHTDELTYSITAPIDDPIMAGSLLESYQRISRALIFALSILGIEARADSVYPQKELSSKKEPVCFEVPSNFEITVAGKKLIGSAQARKNNGVLQHGSLPLTGDLSRITKVLNYETEEKRLKGVATLLNRAGTIQSLTGKQISLADAREAFISAFTKELGISFNISEPSMNELDQAIELEKTKYGTQAWNYRF